MNRRLLLLLFACACLALLLAASCAPSTPKERYLKAMQLEQEGKHTRALRTYEALLPEVPLDERRWLSEILLRIGECYLRLERPAEAFTAFQKSLETSAENTIAQLRLSELYLAAGSLERAVEHANAVLRLAPASLDALAVIGLAHAAVGNTMEARQILVRVLALDPRRMQVALTLADIYGAEGRVEEAREVLLQAGRAAPDSAAAWLALGRLEEQVGNLELAEVHYRRAVLTQDTRETNLRLAQFLQRTARIAEAEIVLRRVDTIVSRESTELPDFEMVTGRPGQALNRYRAALHAGGSQGPAPSQQAQLVARLVTAELEAGKPLLASSPESAQQRFATARRTLERYRDRLDAATVAVLEAEIALAGSDLGEARRQAELALQAAPSSPSARYVHGAVLYRGGRHAEARAEWLAALEHDGNFVPARLALAAHALERGDAQDAAGYVIPAVREEPANLHALLLYGRSLLALRQYDAAGIIARRAQAVAGASPEPLLLLGDIALAANRLPEALARFQQAVLMAPDSAAAVDGLTRVYRTGGVTQAMLRNMEKVAANEPVSVPLLEVTGRLYAEMGRLEDARRCLQRTLELEPGRATAAAALAAVQARAGDTQQAAESAMRSGGFSAALLAALRAEQSDDVENAVRYYEAALRQGERSGIAANNLAWLYARQERELDRALELAAQARTLAPRNPAVLDTQGFVHIKRREYTQAIEVLEAAARLVEDSTKKNVVDGEGELLAGIRRNLAEAYLRAGRPEDAARMQTAE